MKVPVNIKLSPYGIIPSSDLALLNSVKDLLKNNLKFIVIVF